MNPRGMLVTDLDGTLLGSGRTLGEADRAALTELGRRGYLRVVATGRNPYSFLKAVGDDFPIDYAILSSGGAVRDQVSGEYLWTIAMEAVDVRTAIQALLPLDMDLMVLEPLPDNHVFAHYPARSPSPDYWKRIEIYVGHGRPLLPDGQSRLRADDPRLEGLWPGPASQLLAIEPADSGRDAYTEARARLGGYTVLRSSSPLGSGSTWVEVFPRSVSKSQTAAWLARRVGLSARDVLCVGNDYNDEDLLDWGGTSFVVSGAPADLLARFTPVASNDDGGVAEAVSRWLEGRKKPPGKRR